MSFEKILLCRSFTDSPIDIHKSSLELSHLFGPQAWIQVLLKTITFIEK